MKKMLALALVLVTILVVAVPVVADTAKSDDIVVLYTNDVHTYIDGELSYDVLAALKKDLQEEYAHVLLLDAGDHIQGTAYGSMDKGKSIIDMMNAAGYDAATLGNHEFDYGMDGRVKVTDEWAQYPYLSCNFYHETNGVRGANVLDSYKIFDCGSEKIAIVGVTTPETFSKSAPSYFQDGNGNYIYGISGGADGAALQADVQRAIDAAKDKGATMVIGLGHLGVDLSSQPWTSKETIAGITGLDAFIDGHSHTVMENVIVADKNGEDVLLTQTGEYFGTIGMMVIDPDTDTITADLLTKEDLADLEPDAEVKAIKDAWLKQIDAELGEKIGTLAVTLDNYDTDGKRLVRAQETNTGDFAADALYYLFDEMDLDVDAAVMNGGGVRNKAITGDVSYKNCKDIHTFGNVACMQTVTGKQLLNALEWGARGAGTGEEIGGFLHVAGLTYRIDSSVESTVQMDDKGNWTGGPTGAYRVYDVQVYDKETQEYEPLDLNATYNLAGYNYTLRDLGDSFSMFEGSVNVLDYVMEDYLVLANYVQGFENGVVDACNSPLLDKYPYMLLDYSDVNGSGRICVCADNDEDHHCDNCFARMETLCQTDEGSHYCKICGLHMTALAKDEDKDHQCDDEDCGAILSICEDLNGDYICEYCGGYDYGAVTLNVDAQIGNEMVRVFWNGLPDLGETKVPEYTVSVTLDDTVLQTQTIPASGVETYEVTFTDLKNGTEYEISVECEYVQGTGESGHGFWTGLPATPMALPKTLTIGTDFAVRDGLLVDDSGDGWDYEPETNTLILWYADVKTGMTTSDGKANAGVYCMGDLNIVLEDENKIDLSQAEPMEGSSAAISVEGDLTIRGEGSLKAIGGHAGTVSAGIHATGTISINANVHAAATKTDDSRGFAVAAVKGLSIGKLNNAVIMPVKALDGSTIWTVADAEGKPAASAQTAVKQPDAPVYVPVEKPTKQDSCLTDAYSDLESGAWYHEAVNFVLKEGLMNGVGGGKFDPYGTTNRAMIVTILWRLEGEPSVGSADFDDVAEDVWYSDAVNWAASEGIVEGYGNNMFGPMDAITREQLAAILWRYAKSEGQDVSVGENTNILSYADAFTVSDWAYAPLQWACGAGVVNGKDGALVPQGVAFRVETAQMLLNFLR